jgi:hypothetical protein
MPEANENKAASSAGDVEYPITVNIRSGSDTHSITIDSSDATVSDVRFMSRVATFIHYFR